MTKNIITFESNAKQYKIFDENFENSIYIVKSKQCKCCEDCWTQYCKCKSCIAGMYAVFYYNGQNWQNILFEFYNIEKIKIIEEKNIKLKFPYVYRKKIKYIDEKNIEREEIYDRENTYDHFPFFKKSEVKND